MRAINESCKQMWTHTSIEERRLKTFDSLDSDEGQLVNAVWDYANRLFDSGRLQEVDGWFHPQRWRFSALPQRGAFPLRVGDAIEYPNVGGLPFVTHDALYVGRGHFVCMTVLDDDQTNEFKGVWKSDVAQCVVKPLENKTVTGGRHWRLAREHNGDHVTSAERLARVWRALSSVGTYKYDALMWNCQHLRSLWLYPDLGLDSKGADQVFCTVLFGVVAALSMLGVYVFTRRKK